MDKGMSMITELVKRLKDLYVDPELDMLCGVDGECRQAIKESADVIEELSAKLQSANMERSSQYYNGGWIPCKVRLPEENGVYIVSYEDSVRLLEWFNGKWFFYPSNPAREETGTIIAWQPLPESYKVENEGEE